MAIYATALPNDIFSYENDAFCAFSCVFLCHVETEIMRVQCIKHARLLLPMPNVLSLFLAGMRRVAWFEETDMLHHWWDQLRSEVGNQIQH